MTIRASELIDPGEGATDDVPDDDGSVETKSSKGTRPFPERIAELDERIEYLAAERKRLSLEWIAARCKAAGERHLGRKLRALVRAGLIERAEKFAASFMPELEAAEARIARSGA